MVQTLRLSLLAAFACACATAKPPVQSAPSAAATATPETVALRFGWPDHLAARVRIERTREQTGKDAIAFTLNGRFEARRAADEWRVTTADFEGAPAALAPMMKAGEQVITVAGPSGALLRVEGVEAAAAATLASMPQLEGLPPEKRAQFAEMIPGALTKDATETWHALVGVWAGQDLRIGEQYGGDSAVPVALVPGEQVRLHMNLALARRMPCPNGQAQCVELRFKSVPDRADLERVFRRYLDEHGMAEVGGQLAELGAVLEGTLITEPDRLVPYRLEQRRTVGASVTERPEAAAAPMQRVDVTVTTFEY